MGKSLCCINRKKITVLGINSLFGRLTAFLLKQSPHINRLALYDECDISVAADLSYINTQCKIRAYLGSHQLACAVKNADIVLIGDHEDNQSVVAHKKRDFQDESQLLYQYAQVISDAAPSAIVLIALSPVNSLLPLLSEYLIENGTYNSNKVLGITSVDNVRGNKLGGIHNKIDPQKVILPVVGGTSPDTRVPLFSQSRPVIKVNKKHWQNITWDIKNSETLIHKINGRPEAVNKAYSTVRFVHSVLAGLRGEPNIAEIALARTILVPGTQYFALPVILGPEGIEHRFSLPILTKPESLLVEHAISCINKEIDNGLKCLGKHSNKYFTTSSDSSDCNKKGFVQTLIEKVTGPCIQHPYMKHEYELLRNKKNVNLHPEMKPSVHPIRIPFVENDCCQNCNQGCAPHILPQLPSIRRKTSIMPPNISGNILTPFAPIKNKKCNICPNMPCLQRHSDIDLDLMSPDCCSKKFLERQAIECCQQCETTDNDQSCTYCSPKNESSQNSTGDSSHGSQNNTSYYQHGKSSNSENTQEHANSNQDMEDLMKTYSQESRKMARRQFCTIEKSNDSKNVSVIVPEEDVQTSFAEIKKTFENRTDSSKEILETKTTNSEIASDGNFPSLTLHPISNLIPPQPTDQNKDTLNRNVKTPEQIQLTNSFLNKLFSLKLLNNVEQNSKQIEKVAEETMNKTKENTPSEENTEIEGLRINSHQTQKQELKNDDKENEKIPKVTEYECKTPFPEVSKKGSHFGILSYFQNNKGFITPKATSKGHILGPLTKDTNLILLREEGRLKYQANLKKSSPTRTKIERQETSKGKFNFLLNILKGGNNKVEDKKITNNSFDQKNVQILLRAHHLTNNYANEQNTKTRNIVNHLSKAYAPKCPPKFLFGQYFEHPELESDKQIFDNVKDSRNSIAFTDEKKINDKFVPPFKEESVPNISKTSINDKNIQTPKDDSAENKVVVYHIQPTAPQKTKHQPSKPRWKKTISTEHSCDNCELCKRANKQKFINYHLMKSPNQSTFGIPTKYK